MKKKLLSAILTCALFLSLLSGGALAYGEEYENYDPNPAAQQYSDVPIENWAFQSIQTCSQRGWFNGYADGTFHPADLIRRDEAAKVFVEALALPWDKAAPITYTDTQGNWAAGRIEAARYLFPDATNLAGTKSFRPTQTITREETIYALVVAWQYASKVSTCDESVLNMFADSQSISAGVRPYLAVAVSENLVNGMKDPTTGKTNINAQKGLTRAEFATMLARALAHGKGEAGTLALKPDSYPATTTEDRVTLTGKVISNQIADVTLTCNQEKVMLGRDGGFSVTLTLKEGDNTVALVAENSTGLRQTQTITIKKDTAKAAIRLLGTVPSETAQSSMTVIGIVDNYKKECVLFLDGKKVTVGEDGHFEVLLTLKEGANNFTLTVERLGALEATQTIAIKRLATAGAGQWLEKLPDGVTAANFNIEKKEQSRTKTRDVKTSTQEVLDGWTLVKKDGGWGNWSAWQDGSVSASDTRKVETQRVEGTAAHTEYRYHYYQNNAGDRHFCPYYAGWAYEGDYNGGTFHIGYTDWMSTPATLKVSDYNHVNQGNSCTRSGCVDASGTVCAYVVSGTHSERNRVFFEETRQVPASDKTQYRYQDYAGSNIFEKWSDWSDWQDGTKTTTADTQAETRTMYQFTVR